MAGRILLVFYLFSQALFVYCQQKAASTQCDHPIVNNIYTTASTQCDHPIVNNIYATTQQGTHNIGSWWNPAKSCKQIKQNILSSTNGIYYIHDNEIGIYSVYCNMDVAEGGWTLVASVHENNMKGRCTTGDRWSSEQGNSADHPHGDGFWENMATHGSPVSASSDDYKSPGYFSLQAQDIMIYHVPNDTPLHGFETKALFKYYTTSHFLTKYGGNLQQLFKVHYPIRSKVYNMGTDNGPAIPVTWERGNTNSIWNEIGTVIQAETEGGYVQFRAVNHEKNVFSLCPGVRIKTGSGNVEHACIGSTSNNIGHLHEEDYCGDYAARDWKWSANVKSTETLIEAATLIFYR